MKNNRYSMFVIIRIILITLNSFALTWFYTQTNRPATTLFIFLILVFQSVNLIYYLNRVNRDLANFLVFLQENDTTLAFSQKKIENNFKGLTFHLNKINRKLQEVRIEKEQQYQYLQAVIEHVGIGLISYDENGDIELLNKSAKEIFGISNIGNIKIIETQFPELSSVFREINQMNPKLLKIKTQNHELQLTVKSSVLKFNDRIIKLVSFQNIKSELEGQELDSWRKLIRVLRHEIMNSITPITTLTTAIKRSFSDKSRTKSLAEISTENIDDALLSVEVIEERSKGLINFVENFKSLTDLPKLKYAGFFIERMFESIKLLFENELKSKKVKLITEIEHKGLSINADVKLLEQVLINLVKNSMEAFEKPDGIITLRASNQPDGTISIMVIDNGKGIKPEDLENIFVPSFTTKETGTGIGLSISKQIIQLHGGVITVKSRPDEETCFEIELPNCAGTK
jgi:two-component system, NtrC family, nitrogen regulation sensor histidine kinase NtrY